MSVLSVEIKCRGQTHSQLDTNLHLSIGPAWDLNNHVEDSMLFISVERNIMEGRDRVSIFLDEDSVFQGVRSTNLSDAVTHFAIVFGMYYC